MTLTFDAATLKPFTDGEVYMGHETGLYPGGQNVIPKAHQLDGLRIATSIQPLDISGTQQADGRIAAVIMGHSNCQQYFTALQNSLAERSAQLNPRASILNAAVGGQQLPEIRELEGKVWSKANEMLTQSNLSPRQVQVLFLHTTYHGAQNRTQMPAGDFPEKMQHMRLDLARVLEHCVTLFPNLKIAYLTCDGLRQFTGFEPHVWREAFGIKWMIEAQIGRKPRTQFEGNHRFIPWLQWGPYIWDNTWSEEQFTDGVHPGLNARAIFVEKYWNFLRSDPISAKWLFK